MEKVSVIVPIYNLEDYIYRCVISIINQTYKNIEIILVDDGSKDDSPKIIDGLALTDTRIKVVHISNGGVSNARKTGLRHSTGDWIMFVDGDDYLPLKAIESLAKHTDKYKLIIGASLKIRPKRTTTRIWGNGEISQKKYVKDLIYYKMSASPCSKLFHSSLLNSKDFDFPKNITVGEDLLMNISVGLKTDSVYAINDIVYNYIVRENSASKSHVPSHEYEYNKSSYIKKLLNDSDLFTKQEKELIYNLSIWRKIYVDTTKHSLRKGISVENYIYDECRKLTKKIGIKYIMKVYGKKYVLFCLLLNSKSLLELVYKK